MTCVFTLTHQQKQLLDYIDRFVAAHRGVAPTFEQMAVALGLRSKGNVHRMLGTLEERGYLRRIKHTARAIQILHRPHACPSCETEVQASFNFCPGCARPLRAKARAA